MHRNGVALSGLPPRSASIRQSHVAVPPHDEGMATHDAVSLHGPSIPLPTFAEQYVPSGQLVHASSRSQPHPPISAAIPTRMSAAAEPRARIARGVGGVGG
jgi:hypothetical protein